MKKPIQGIIIGGSPSTGSSLLRQILNRHSEIVCAPETHIWCKELLFENWNEYKMQLLRRSIFGVASKGFFHYIGIAKEDIPHYDKRLVKKMLLDSRDIYAFFRIFMQNFFGLHDGEIYGEKTPANALNFKPILESSEDVLCVHTSRDPYDTIASLVARGMSPLDATAFYLYNSAHAIEHKYDERFVSIKYEDLVEDPKEALAGLLSKLFVEFEAKMIEPGIKNSGTITKLKGWNYDETAAIKKGSVGRFGSMSKEVQDEIILYVWHLHIQDKLFLRHKSIPSINEVMDYQTLVPATKLTKTHETALSKHKRKHNYLFTASTVANYPLCLK